MSLRFYETMTAWLRAGKRVAVVSIVETVGSTPRKPGTKMLVSEGLELYGTIGGGCVEADAIHAAREVMRTLRPKLLTVDITLKNADEIDMLCGGKITFYVEPAVSEIQLLICGGGHIAKALARACSDLDFSLTVLDDRPQFANNTRFPNADAVLTAEFADLATAVDLSRRTFAVVVTRGHSGDEVCLRALLRAGVARILMVGSRAKWAIVRKKLADDGFTPEELDRVQSPCGLDIGSITPEEIAISIAAELIRVKNT